MHVLCYTYLKKKRKKNYALKARAFQCKNATVRTTSLATISFLREGYNSSKFRTRKVCRSVRRTRKNKFTHNVRTSFVGLLRFHFLTQNTCVKKINVRDFDVKILNVTLLFVCVCVKKSKRMS